MIDFHSHILPGIDDGAQDTSESIAILRAAYAQGTAVIVATPHYYCDDMNVHTFLRKRDAAMKELREAMSKLNEPFPEIVLGAEVYLTYDLLQKDKLSRLCIGDTSFMLVELPYSGISDNVMKWLFALIAHKGLTPVLAHIERYTLKKADMERVYKLMKMDIYTQINCNSYLQLRSRRCIKKLIRCNAVHLLGTDCHNLTSRGYYLKKVYKKLSRRYGKAFVFKLKNNAQAILEGKRPVKEMNY